MKHRHRVGVGLLVALAAVVGIAWAMAGGSGGARLVMPLASSTSIGAPIPTGVPFSYGLLAVKNSGHKGVTIERVRLLGGGGPLEQLGAYTLPVPNRHGIGFVKGYAPTGAPMKVAPGAEVQIVVGLRMNAPGKVTFRAIGLDYSSGGATRSDEYATSARICAPTARYLHDCHGLLR